MLKLLIRLSLNIGVGLFRYRLTQRSTWAVHPTPGWHFGRSETGYTDTAISFVLDPARLRPTNKSSSEQPPTNIDY
jgi:hypothetical protein